MTEETKTLPALDAVITPEDTRSKGSGSYSINYVPWGKISQLLRKHAPGWEPIMIDSKDGGPEHRAPDGSYYLMISFEHADGRRTKPVPHAIMDNRMNAKKTVDSRDISDGFVRGMCKAAAMTFGLGIEMWTGDPLDEGDTPAKKLVPAAKPAPKPAPEAKQKRSADDKATRFTGEASAQKTKPQMIAMIGDAKAERRLEREQLIEIAKSVGVDYGGGNPSTLSLKDLQDLHAAILEFPLPKIEPGDPVPF